MRFASRAALAVAVLVASCAAPAFVACASFEESNPTPPTAEDAADASIDTPIANDGPGTPDSARACEPEPMGPVEAGPESTACLANDGNVDLLTSDDHCGFCGNVCSPSKCNQGVCRAITVQTDVVYVGFSDATDGTSLYYGTGTSGCGAAAIQKLALAAGDPQVSAALTESGGCINWVGIRGDRLFYLHSAAGIRETSVNDPKPNDKTFLGSNDVQSVHLASDRMFVLHGDAQVQAIPLDGSAILTIHDDASLRTVAFVGDGESAWWVTEPRVAEGGPLESTLRTRRPGESSTTFRATGLTGITRMAVDDTHVYFATIAGEVHRVRKDGAGDREVVTRIDIPNHNPRSLAVVGDYLYVAVSDDQSTYNGTFELYRAKKCGGRPRLLGRDYMIGAQLFPYGDWMYFGGYQVARFPITKR